MSSFVQLTLFFVALVVAVAHAGKSLSYEEIGHDEVGDHISVAYVLKSKVGDKLEILPLEKVKLGAKEKVRNFLPRIQALIRKHIQKIGTWAHGKHFSEGSKSATEIADEIQAALHNDEANDDGTFPDEACLEAHLIVPRADGMGVDKVKLVRVVIIDRAHELLGAPVEMGEDGVVAHRIRIVIAHKDQITNGVF